MGPRFPAVLEPDNLGEMGFIDLQQPRRMAHAIARGRRVECIQLDAQTLEDMIKNLEGGAGFETVRPL